MAKRKHSLDPNDDQERAGWEAQVLGRSSSVSRLSGETTSDTETSEPNYKRKTYLLSPELIEAIANTAQEEGMQINELVRFLLSYSLQAVQEGEVELPGKVVLVKQRIIE